MKNLQPILARFLVIGLLTGILIQSQLAFRSEKVELLQGISKLRDDIHGLETRVEQFSNNARNVTFPNQLVWREASKSAAEFQLQETTVSAAVQSGLKVVNLARSPTLSETEFQSVSLTIEVEGLLANALSFLAELESVDPRVAISTLRIKPSQRLSATDVGTMVFMQVSIWSYWSDSA